MSSLLNPYIVGLPPAWTVGSISSLAAWLDGTLGLTDAGGGACSAWADQKGGDDGATSATYRPSITTDATSGKQCLSFTNKSMVIADSARLYASAGITVCVAGDFTSWATYANLALNDSTGWGGYLGWRLVNNNGTVQATVGTSGGAKTCDFGAVGGMTGRQILTLRAGTTSNKLEIWKNGTSVTSVASTGTISDTSYPVILMGNEGGAGSVNGKLFEVIICAGDISNSDLSSMHSYLATKWSIP